MHLVGESDSSCRAYAVPIDLPSVIYCARGGFTFGGFDVHACERVKVGEPAGPIDLLYSEVEPVE